MDATSTQNNITSPWSHIEAQRLETALCGTSLVDWPQLFETGTGQIVNMASRKCAPGGSLTNGSTNLIWWTYADKPRAESVAFAFVNMGANFTNRAMLIRALGLDRAVSAPIVNPANHHRYILLSASTWKEAEAGAVKIGGHLATIRNQTEEDWIFKTFGNYSGTQRLLWIGLSDRDKKFHFTWSSGESVSFTAWAKGEPNNAGGGEDYVSIYYPYHSQHNRWNDWGDRAKDPIGLPMNGVAEIIPEETHSISPANAETPAAIPVAEITPALNISSSSGAIRLQWPAGFSGYMLEATTSLEQPFTMFGYTEELNPQTGLVAVTITNPGTQMFFRLRKP
ncbi:MAG TPA: C-type lectin domain-containing protein [Candidatus Saccharimonadales bacterium]|nr:C-type lectin domain-containing protein [Candidatus Saccharimonadales bacterium]